MTTEPLKPLNEIFDVSISYQVAMLYTELIEPKISLCCSLTLPGSASLPDLSPLL